MVTMDFIFTLLCIFVIVVDSVKPQNIYSSIAQGLCPPSSSCLRIRECGLLVDLVDRSCMDADRFRSLTCGYVGTEPMLCCPLVGKTSIAPGIENVLLRKNINNARPPTEDNSEKPCGVPMLKGTPSYNGIGAQPWIVRIGFASPRTKEVKYPCGGSIISNRVVLTAAHCALAKSENYKLHSILAGEYTTNTDVDCGEEFCALPTQHIEISRVIVHPGYKNDNTFRDDVALLYLKEDINYTVTAQPLCIFEEKEQLIGQQGTLVGWGKLAGQSAAGTSQQSLTLPLVSMDKCRAVYSGTIPLSSDAEQICAGGIEGYDACAGFGGAPLIKQHAVAGVFYQVGLLSFGADKCGSRDIPSVYVNTQHYSHWIRENALINY